MRDDYAMSHSTGEASNTAHIISEPHSVLHTSDEFHHGHSHAQDSKHAGGHHLLQVENLSVGFSMYDSTASFWTARRRQINVVNNLSLSVHAGEVLAIVGASGSGKTVLADALMGIHEPNMCVQGHIWFDGQELDKASLTRLRGNGISMVPQSIAYLNPVMPIGKQVRGAGHGATHAHRAADAERRLTRQRELFSTYGLARGVENLYPHQLSGGMARRILLICALMDNPKLIIADEPTPGLDLDLAVRALDDLRQFANSGGGVLLITHDIELALRVADRVAVFHRGTVIEETAVANFASPELLQHPFSQALWHAMPEHDFAVGETGAMYDHSKVNDETPSISEVSS